MAPLIDIPGFKIGHWTNEKDLTGCSVLLFDQPALAACDVRGAAPGSRELALLAPGRAVQHTDAILFTGGSAFGLAAADGVAQWLREHGRGFPTPVIPVPIVPAAVIFDLGTGNAVAPDASAGYASCAQAVDISQAESFRVGAGAGATFGNIGGTEFAKPGGIAIAQVPVDDGTVTAVVVLNAFGDARHAGTEDPRPRLLDSRALAPTLGESTTLMACVIDSPLEHDALINVTVAMHDALSRMIVPAHTLADGDIAFAVSLVDGGPGNAEQTMRVSMAAELAVEHAIESLTGTQ